MRMNLKLKHDLIKLYGVDKGISVYGKAIQNSEGRSLDFNHLRHTASYLASLFSFRLTPESYGYWYKVYDDLRKLETSKYTSWVKVTQGGF